MSSTPLVSNVLKTFGCLSYNGNTGEPPFYKTSVENKLVIDVGANVGTDYAGPGAKKGHLVYAFEPFRSTGDIFVSKMLSLYDLTVENGGLTVVDVVPGEKAIVPRNLMKQVLTTKRGHVVLFRAAAGAQTTKMEVSVYENDEVNSLISENAGETNKLMSTETIAVVRLDDIVLPEDPLYLFKIDAQGYEPMVLEGAASVLKENVPDIITFEFWPKGIGRGVGQSPSAMLTQLWDAGFHCFDWSTNRHIPDDRPNDVKGFVESFYENAKVPFGGSRCKTEVCREFGLWEEMVCAKLKP